MTLNIGFAQDFYPADMPIDADAISYAEGLFFKNLEYGNQYVFYRNSAHEYYFCVSSEMTYSDSRIIANDVTIFNFNLEEGNTFLTQYTVEDFVFYPSSEPVFSTVGPFATFITLDNEGGGNNAISYAILICCSILVLDGVVSRLFRNC